MRHGSASEVFGDAIGVTIIRQQIARQFYRLKQDSESCANGWKHFETVHAADIEGYHSITAYMAVAAIRQAQAGTVDPLKVAGAIIGVAAEMQANDEDADSGRYAVCGRFAMNIAVAYEAVSSTTATYDALETGLNFVVGYGER